MLNEKINLIRQLSEWKGLLKTVGQGEGKMSLTTDGASRLQNTIDDVIEYLNDEGLDNKVKSPVKKDNEFPKIQF